MTTTSTAMTAAMPMRILRSTGSPLDFRCCEALRAKVGGECQSRNELATAIAVVAPACAKGYVRWGDGELDARRRGSDFGQRARCLRDANASRASGLLRHWPC